MSRRGSLYYYGRREYGVTAVTDQPIPASAPWKFTRITRMAAGSTPSAWCKLGGQACSWRWAVGYGVGE